MKVRAAVLSEPALPPPYAASRPLALRELQLEPPGPGEVLIAVGAAGLCHSDLSVIDGNRPRPAWGYSDHCIGIGGCIEAFTEARPAIIEKHIKMVEDCVDAEHSVFPNVFKSMVQEIRKMEAAKTTALGSH